MPELNTFTIDGHTMAALPLNPKQSGTPVILIHGVVDSLYFWSRGAANPFMQFGPCTSLALPGHFPAVFPNGYQPGDLTAEALAQLTACAIRRIAGEQPVLLAGHSTGAFAVLATAAMFPELTRGVVSISGFAKGHWSGILAAYQWLSRYDLAGKAAFGAMFALGRNKRLFELTARYHTPGQDEAMKTSHEAFLGLSPEAMQLYFAAMHELDIFPQLGNIQSPALVIAGSRDLAVPPSQSRQITAAIPQAECRILPGGTHHPFNDNPAWYDTVVSGWLNKMYGSH